MVGLAGTIFSAKRRPDAVRGGIEGHARGNCVLDVPDRAGSTDLAETCANYDELISGNEA